jgi:alkylation response protein AidB-like acyl-CoA dehydrogenase
VSIARLAEAHLDAVAILDEAGRRPVDGAVYGVWAADGGRHDVTGAVVDAGCASRSLQGRKPFASGLGVVTHALVTVRDAASDDRVLVEVDVSELRGIGDPWTTAALREAHTDTASFQGDSIGSVVGDPGWYLRRPGFWHGACGPAACWAGAAAGLVDAAAHLVDADPHRRAHLGAMRAAAWSMLACLRAAGDEIDASPADASAARERALCLRHVVERTASDVLDRFGRAFGPRPFVQNASIQQRFADTHLYLRQHHGERDAAVLGADR